MNTDLHALVIDDDAQIRRFIRFILESGGWIVDEAESAGNAFEKMSSRPWRLVFCDVVLGKQDGYEVLRSFSQNLKNASVVLMTGYGSAAGALEATALGARDYLLKPFADDDIIRIADQVRQINHRALDNKRGPLAAMPYQVPKVDKLVGRSASFVHCLKLVGKVAGTGLPILITGESGTGKEEIARLIHKKSERSDGQFVAVNCGAIPAELIESELFGHERGAFSGADRERKGLWEEADGGTIFLDEITETTPLFQVKLLRVLQEGEIRRVGSNKTIKINSRVIAATNRDIDREVKEGRFRQDLMYRLNAVNIEIPPLRDRKDDIPLLVEHFCRSQQTSAADHRFSDEAMQILKTHRWKGNIRELENVVLHATAMAEGIVYPENLPGYLFARGVNSGAEIKNKDLIPKAEDFVPLAELEKSYILRVLESTGGNKQAAARILKIDRKTIRRILQREE